MKNLILSVLFLVVSASSAFAGLDESLVAATAGDVNAQIAVGEMYYDGRYTEKNQPEAFNWFLRAAEQGNTYAMNFVGYMYESGKGVAMDSQKAMSWYRKSIAKGDFTTQSSLNDMIIAAMQKNLAPRF